MCYLGSGDVALHITLLLLLSTHRHSVFNLVWYKIGVKMVVTIVVVVVVVMVRKRVEDALR